MVGVPVFAKKVGLMIFTKQNAIFIKNDFLMES